MVAHAHVVPVRVDSLWVDERTRIAEPSGHFERLPYNDGRRDINAGIPFLAEHVTATPFEDASAWLPVGLHLHWTLPRHLTIGHHRPDRETGSARARVHGVDFPLLPNRWLVRTPRDEWWMVEGDYVHPEGGHETQPGVSYLLTPEQRADLGTNAPARFVGRQMRLREWLSAQDGSAQHLAGITAVGWGEPSFHGFYPNCWSVLGFHDPEPDAGATSSYDVYGYYSDPAMDPLARFVAQAADSGDGLRQAIDDEFGWRTQSTETFGWQPPDGMLCVGSVWPSYSAEPLPETRTTCTFGLSGVEALASHIAREAMGDQPAEDAPLTLPEMEEAIEAIVLAPRLDLDRPDAHAALTQARHDHGFVAVAGGSRWTIRTKGPALSADAGHAPAGVHGSAPDEAAGILADLNRIQQSLDRLTREQNSQSEQLYADWCTYLTCKYPRRGTEEDHPDPDAVRRHIELNGLAALEATFAQWRRLLGRMTALTRDVISALAVHDLATLTIAADDVSDWGAFEAALRGLGAISDRGSSGAHGGDDDERRGLLVAIANRMIIDDPIPPARVLVSGARVDDGLVQWLTRPPPTESDMLAESAPVRDHIFGRDDDPTARHQRVWLAHLTQTAATWHSAVRARAALEIAAGGALRAVAKSRHYLEVLPGPRFWGPRDPVVLLEGPVVARSPRRQTAGPEARPTCSVLPMGLDPAAWIPRAVVSTGPERTGLGAEIATLIRNLPGGNVGTTPTSWHPVYVDWAVSVEDGRASAGDEDRYGPAYVTERYRLRPGEPDLRARVGLGGLPGRRLYEYSGRSHLSAHVTTELTDAVSRLPEHVAEDSEMFGRVAQWAGRHVAADQATLQTISLTGFNTGHLGHQPMLPLTVEDPLAFAESRGFAQRVARAVGRHTTMAPTPLGSFRPIRAGRVTLDGLRVIDSFGRVADVEVRSAGVSRNVHRSRALAEPGDPGAGVTLPPRVVPPARLSVRWLAAANTVGAHPGQEPGEAQDHPSTGPVCGWLMPNVLEGRLMVYQASGEAIGSIDGFGSWRPAPGSDVYLPPDDIDNPVLRHVVLQLLHESADERGSILEEMMSSLERIEPDSHSQHRALSLLMGRPIAVVRASVRLELLGRPPASQTWEAQRAHVAGAPPNTAGIRDVEFPVRIGEPGQLDDGVVGFWVDRRGATSEPQGNGTPFDGPLMTPRSPLEGPAPAIAAGEQQDPASSGGHLHLRVDAEPIYLTVLMDPRGTLHATTGILPTKTIDIPHEQYASSLDSIEVTFLTSPVLCDPGTIQVAVPSEPGYAWSWMQRSPEGWSRVPASQIGTPTTAATLTAQQQIREGWLTLTPAPAPGTTGVGPSGGAS